MANRVFIDPRTGTKWIIRKHGIYNSALVIEHHSQKEAYFTYNFMDKQGISLYVPVLSTPVKLSYEEFISVVIKEMVQHGDKK